MSEKTNDLRRKQGKYIWRHEIRPQHQELGIESLLWMCAQYKGYAVMTAVIEQDKKHLLLLRYFFNSFQLKPHVTTNNCLHILSQRMGYRVIAHPTARFSSWYFMNQTWYRGQEVGQLAMCQQKRPSVMYRGVIINLTNKSHILRPPYQLFTGK